MNTRSTPINQLPNQNTQNVFVNDQQRNMVIQAQNAISQLQLPQNTQQTLEHDEDDNTIQEVLNQIQSTNTQDAQYQQQIQQMQQIQQLQQMQQMQQLQKESIQAPQLPPQIMSQNSNLQTPQLQQFIQLPQQVPTPVYDNLGGVSQLPPQPQVIHDPLDHVSEGGVFAIITSITEDVKFAAFIFLLFVIVHFIPIDKFLMRYFAIDKIPYYDVLLKGLVAFVVVIVFRKLFANKK